MILKEVLYVFLVLSGIPVGMFLSILCKDEVGLWRRRFRFIALICFLIIGFLIFIDIENKIALIVFLFFVIVVSLNVRLRRLSTEE
jgi:hypothetical protein